MAKSAAPRGDRWDFQALIPSDSLGLCYADLRCVEKLLETTALLETLVLSGSPNEVPFYWDRHTGAKHDPHVSGGEREHMNDGRTALPLVCTIDIYRTLFAYNRRKAWDLNISNHA